MSIEKNTPNLLKKLGLSFTSIINSTMDMISDPAALGIYIYLSSKPDDWDIQETELMRRFTKGRDFIQARLKELKDIGLLDVRSTRNEKGHITGWTTILYSHITENPYCGTNQNTENPDSGKPHILDKPVHTNKRFSLVKKESITTTTNETSGNFIFSKQNDEKLIRMRNKFLPTDSRSNDEFLMQCKHHVESDESKKKFSLPQRLAGLERIIAKGCFETPIGYKSPQAVKQKAQSDEDDILLSQYKAWLGGHNKFTALEKWIPDAVKRERAIAVWEKEQEFLKRKSENNAMAAK